MEKFLRTKDVAEKMSVSKVLAISLLREHGVFPIDFGYGRGHGLRWLESAVDSVMREMFEKAQPQPKQISTNKIKKPHKSLASLSTKELYELTRVSNA